MHGAGQRLDEGGHRHIEAVGEEVDVPRRDGQVLGARSRVGDAQGPEVEAHVAVPLPAGPAAAAIIVGVGRDIGPDADRRYVTAHGDHLAGELVPGYQRVTASENSPSARWISVPQIPHARTSTTTSSGPGAGSAISPTSTSPGLSITTACMAGHPLRPTPAHAGQSWEPLGTLLQREMSV